MMKNHDLRELQRQNELAVFVRYESALKAAYAQSQNPQPRRRMFADSGGRICRDRIFSSFS